MTLKQTEHQEELQESVSSWKANGQKIGFVPTMGALHDGHLSLIKIAKDHADKVVVSIFVNPQQFAPHEDFDSYPRDIESDIEKLENLGIDLLYLPNKTAMYPIDFATYFDIKGPNIGLDSDHRPHFFNGVAVVVCKLFNQVRPDIAVFGEKDYQQLCIIRQMVQDLDMGIEIIGGPLVRDENGLALSSRNQYLSQEEYKIACKLNEILFETADQIKKTPDQVPGLLQSASEKITQAGFDRVDYVELRVEHTLKPVTALSKPSRLLAAGWVGKTRLLDNIGITPEL